MARDQELTRTARILEMIWLISHQPRRWTRAALAEKFEISERRVSQDLDIIRHGLVFDVKPCYGQGYYFTRLPNLPAVSYTVPEALALILAAQSARQIGGVSQTDLASAIARLTAVIPDELRAMVERLNSAAPIAPPDDRRQELLATISHATSMNRQVRMRYTSASRGGAESTRVVDPYAVVPYLRSWHLVGYCHLREDVRVFKLDRILDIEPLSSGFSHDEDFDLTAFLGEGWGLMRGMEGPVETVELRFEQPAARWVAEEHWHATQRLEWLDAECLRFTVRIQITPEFRRWVFRYGRQVRIIAPDHLREWVHDEARAMLAGG